MRVLLLILVFIPLLCATASAEIADRKGRSAGGSFALGFFFGPLGLIIVALLPGEEEATHRAAGRTKRCPACAELVQPQAKLCRYCGTELDPLPATPTKPRGAVCERGHMNIARARRCGECGSTELTLV